MRESPYIPSICEPPSYIRIVRPPYKLEYLSGEPIDITGMVVVAYMSSGIEWGTISNDRLTIIPSTATGTGTQTIAVRYTNEVGAVLTDTFDISVIYLPESIRIDTLPTKLSYVDQESINLTGAVVKAYDGDGNIWEDTGYSGGVIPLNELTISPTKATYVGGGSEQYQTDGAVTVGNVTLEDTLYCIPIVAGAAYVGGGSPTQEQLARLYELRENATFGTCYGPSADTDGDVWVIGHEDVRSYNTLKNTRVAIAHYGNGNIIVESSLDEGVLGLGHENYSSSYSPYAASYTYDNKTVYYHYDSVTVTSSDVEISNIDVPTGWAATDKVKAIAWASWYMATLAESQDITVSWNRPMDSRILTDTFEISVAPLPDHINIDTLPTKLAYVDRESIDLTGAVVRAYNSNDSIWESASYSGGIIPLNELAVTPSTAIYEGGEIHYDEKTSTPFTVVSMVPALDLFHEELSHIYTYVDDCGAVSFIEGYLEDNNNSLIDMEFYENSSNYNGGMLKIRIFPSITLNTTVTSYTQCMEIVIACGGTSSGGSKTSFEQPWHFYQNNFNGSYNVLPYVGREYIANPSATLIGETNTSNGNARISGSALITTTWSRPVDERALTDTFEIEVSPQ